MITCLNLRPDSTRPDYLRRIDTPSVVLPAGAWHPRAELTDTGGRRLLVVSSGSTIGVAYGGKVLSTVSVASEPTAIFAIGHKVVVMTATARHTFTAGTDGLQADPGADSGTADIPGCVLCATASPDLSYYAPSLTLSKAYGGSRELTDADRRKVATHAASVYRGIDSAARAAGYMWQPAVGCLRLLRADGTVVASTPPVLLTHPGRRPAGMSLSFASSDTQTIAGGARDFTAWRVAVRLPRLTDVAAVQVVMSPALHAATPDAESAIVSGLGASPFCTVTFRPGAAQEYGNPDRAAAAAALAERLDECGSAVATIQGPFDTGYSGELPVTLPDDIDAANDRLRRLLTAHGEAAATATAGEAALRSGRFTATACAVAGRAVVWSGLSLLPGTGTDPRTFAAASADAPWRGYVRLRYPDGTSAVTVTSSDTDAPTLYNPMLYVSSARAVSLEIGLSITGHGYFRDTFALTPAPGGGGAAFAASDMQPIPPTPATSYSEPQPTAAPEPLPGVIAVAEASAPFSIKATAYTAIGPVTALTLARFGQSAWDFGRARFYAFGTGGIHTVTTGSDLSSLSISRLDSRPVESVPVDSPSGVYAIAGTDIVCLSGTRATTVNSGRAYAALLYDRRRHELWCLPISGSATVLCPDSQGNSYTAYVGAIDPARTLSAPCGAYVALGTGIIDISTPGPPADMAVSLALEMRPGSSRRGRSGTMRAVTLDIEGRVGQLDITLTRRHHGRPAPAPDVSLRVDGRLRSPMRLPWYGPASATAVLSVRGTAAADFSLRMTP